MNNDSSWSSYFGNASKKLLNKAMDIAETNIKKVEDKVTTLISENILEETASNIIISLELIYITENIISLAYPGNHLNIVSTYLNTNHKDHYMIWNISEESYDCFKFDNQVLEHKFPGHPAPPLGLLFQICTEIENWLDADNKNVAIIHCLTGKGRTSSLISCLLTWLGEFEEPILALDYICQRKKTTIDILTIPSQRRYLDYFSSIINGIQPKSKPLLLRRVIINSIPKFGNNNNNEGCRPYIQLFKCGVLLATSVVTLSSSSSYDNNNSNNTDIKKQSTWINSTEGSASFTINVAVQGDLLLRCRHSNNSGSKISMFRAAFHTGYVDQSGILRLNKSQLDSAFCDDKFEDDFFIDLIFAPIENAITAVAMPKINNNVNSNSNNINDNEIKSVSGSPKLNLPNDSGLIIDYQNIDKYEMSLHRDGRFWDAIKHRNTKKGKRNNRQYLTKSPQQFCIVDKNDKNLNINISNNEIINNNNNNSSNHETFYNNNNDNNILMQQLLDASKENNEIKINNDNDIEINEETENINYNDDIFNDNGDIDVDDYNDDDDEMINSMMNMIEKQFSINDSNENQNNTKTDNIDNLDIKNDLKLNINDVVNNIKIEGEEEYSDVLDELERFMGSC